MADNNVYEGWATEGVKNSAPTGCSVDEVAVANIPEPLPTPSNESTTHVALVDTYNANDVQKKVNSNSKIVDIINKSMIPLLHSRGYTELQYMTDLSQFTDYGKAIASLTANDLKDATNQFIIGAVRTSFIESAVKKINSVFNVDALRLAELLQICYRKTTFEAHENNAFNLVDGAQYDITTYHGFEFDTKVFGKAKSFRLEYSIPNQLFDSAFQDASKITELYNYILNCVNEDMVDKQNALLLSLYQSVIMTCTHKISLVTKFSSDVLGTDGSTNAHKTWAEIRGDEELMRQFSAWFNETIDALGVGMVAKTSKYNDGTVLTTTPNDRRVTVLNTIFNSTLKNNKYSAFHEIGMPSVELVDFWQTSGDDLVPSLADVTSVSVNVNGSLTTKTMIVGFVADKNLGGVYVAPQKITSNYNGNGDFTNYWDAYTYNNILDSRANCVLLALD